MKKKTFNVIGNSNFSFCLYNFFCRYSKWRLFQNWNKKSKFKHFWPVTFLFLDVVRYVDNWKCFETYATSSPTLAPYIFSVLWLLQNGGQLKIENIKKSQLFYFSSCFEFYATGSTTLFPDIFPHRSPFKNCGHLKIVYDSKCLKIWAISSTTSK